jgi:prepilin-type N-terminal cleavage/methylation domain-containing protein
MWPTHRSRAGYSLIELLVVLAIVAIITIVGVTVIGDRKTNSVRSVMDQIEGVLANAQNTAVLSSMDVYVSSTGQWTDGSLVLDGRALNTAAVSTPLVAADIKAGQDAKRLGSPAECFRSLYLSAINKEHQSAGVDCGNGWYATARGTAQDLKLVAPVSTNPALLNAMGTALFTGGDSCAILNGQTRRFETGFYIVVVGLAGGIPLAGGPVGIILVPQNSSNVYKFYKPSGSITWRRL